jgi:hypothetical protein
MSRFSTKEELLTDAAAARTKLERLLEEMPDAAKVQPIVDGMSAKDFITHRNAWGRMMISWYNEAAAGGAPAVPAQGYTWAQLNELNAVIHAQFADTPLAEAEASFTRTNDELFELIGACTEAELFEKRFYSFTGTTDLAEYFTSATGANYRSAYKNINRWWRANKDGAAAG